MKKIANNSDFEMLSLQKNTKFWKVIEVGE